MWKSSMRPDRRQLTCAIRLHMNGSFWSCEAVLSTTHTVGWSHFVRGKRSERRALCPQSTEGAVSYPLQWMTYHGAGAPWHRLWKAMKTKVSQWTVGLDRAVIQISIKVKCGLKFLKSPLSWCECTGAYRVTRTGAGHKAAERDNGWTWCWKEKGEQKKPSHTKSVTPLTTWGEQGIGGNWLLSPSSVSSW